jgi:CheY-like chemotaxis protein/MinD-like ATPase involved in chromosome partitioning or flagellar assembly
MKMGAKILVVDDEPNVLRLIGYALQVEGYEIVTAETGVEALNKVETERPDLVILDIMLPDLSGIEVCQKLRSKTGMIDLPIIMLSARTQVGDKIKGLEAGADEYVTKPVDSDEMVARVSALLDRTRRLRQAQAVQLGKVLGFMGAKGGVGTTTVALNVASVLTRQGKSVIAVELRPDYGTFSLQLRKVPDENLGTLPELDPERSNERELSKRLFSYQFGLRILFGPQKADEFKEIEPDQAKAVIEGLADMADYIVIDLSCYASGAGQAAIRRCDFVALVVEPELTCVMSGKVALELLRSWGVSGGLVGAVVVNRTMVARAMKLHEIRSRLGCEIVGVVPPAAEACIAAQERGVPLAIYEPDSRVAVNLTEMTNRLVTGEVIAVGL